MTTNGYELKEIKITSLPLLPEDELFQKSLEWWVKIMALSLSIDESLIKNHPPTYEEQVNERLRT